MQVCWYFASLKKFALLLHEMKTWLSLTKTLRCCRSITTTKIQVRIVLSRIGQRGNRAQCMHLDLRSFTSRKKNIQLGLHTIGCIAHQSVSFRHIYKIIVILTLIISYYAFALYVTTRNILNCRLDAKHNILYLIVIRPQLIQNLKYSLIHFKTNISRL